MNKSTNLKLNIIEGTDIPNYAPWNENMNKIDKAYGDMNTQIDTNKSSIELIKTDDAVRDTKINNNTSRINDVNTVANNALSNANIAQDIATSANVKISKIEKEKNIVEITQNGKKVKAERTIFIFDVLNDNIHSNRSLELLKTEDLPTELGHYCALQLYKSFFNIDLTDFIDVSKDTDFTKYRFDGYAMNREPMYGGVTTHPRMDLQYAGYHGGMQKCIATYIGVNYVWSDHTNYPNSIVQYDPSGNCYAVLIVYKILDE